MPDRIPLSVPDLRGREAELLLGCVRDNWVSSAGPEVTAFENAMAQLTGRNHAVATVNGTAALHLALLAAGVKPGDQVVVPDWTFAASVNAAAHAGATPAFVDVREADWAIDPALVSEMLANHPTIRAVIAVDPLGHTADLDAVEAACASYGVPVIEDAAGAIGARYRGRPSGSGGTAAIFSFNGNKTVTAGGGGMLVTDDAALAEHVRHLSTQARPGDDYVHDMIGFNYRMTNVNAALGLAQYERLDEMVAARRAIAARYDEAFSGLAMVTRMPRPDYCESVSWLYSVRLPDETSARSLIASCDEAGVEARLFWRSLSAQIPWADTPRLLRGVSTALSGTVVSLPSSSSLGEQDQRRVIDTVTAWHDSLVGAEA
ncbi:MAG: pyridoxal-5'-phosphate-dependent protein [Alphaproteobacteria bacterium]|nr:pyridoxal-5'-phosphate-dependent protein [Alphaproteobacteria bacterium]|tara:strand:+ start:646 stop:1770 length:1125 start_codon:yes stop_codon:yes gene_type:complete